jgi:RNA polymerase sigma-70 factor (ECF subfamily)
LREFPLSQSSNDESLLLDTRSELLEVYWSRRPALTRFLTARLGSEEDAEDAIQELYLHIGKVDRSLEIKDTAAYLFRTAANLAKDQTRSRNRTAARERAWASLQRGSDAPEADDAPSAERAYAALQRLAEVRRALDELSPQCRRIFMLHKFEGLTHQEIASRANISRSTVEKHMHTALRHLMKRFGRD